MERGPEVRAVFEEYLARQGTDRNDGFLNPGVRLQSLYSELSLIDALSSTGVDRASSLVLDVGAGDGGSLASFVSIGFPYANLCGIDVVPDYVSAGRHRWPHFDLRVMDATEMSFPEGSFDLVTSSGVFVQILDDDVARRIAGEMCRVVKPGGYLVVRDWWFPHYDRHHYHPLSRKRRAAIFPRSLGLEERGRFRGPLIPPLGRLLSKYARGLYGPVHSIFPFLSGQATWVWRRNAGQGT